MEEKDYQNSQEFLIESNAFTLRRISHEELKSIILCRLKARYGSKVREDFMIESGHLCFSGEKLVIPLSCLNIDYYFDFEKDKYHLDEMPDRYERKKER